MKPVVFLSPAEEEVSEAARYYESQAPDLGSDFLSEVRRTIDGIALNPEAGAVVSPRLKRRLVRRFPYGILYRIDPQETVVLPVMHLHRGPGYWQERLS